MSSRRNQAARSLTSRLTLSASSSPGAQRVGLSLCLCRGETGIMADSQTVALYVVTQRLNHPVGHDIAHLTLITGSSFAQAYRQRSIGIAPSTAMLTVDVGGRGAGMGAWRATPVDVLRRRRAYALNPDRVRTWTLNACYRGTTRQANPSGPSREFRGKC